MKKVIIYAGEKKKKKYAGAPVSIKSQYLTLKN